MESKKSATFRLKFVELLWVVLVSIILVGTTIYGPFFLPKPPSLKGFQVAKIEGVCWDLPTGYSVGKNIAQEIADLGGQAEMMYDHTWEISWHRKACRESIPSARAGGRVIHYEAACYDTGCRVVIRMDAITAMGEAEASDICINCPPPHPDLLLDLAVERVVQDMARKRQKKQRR